MFLFSSKTNRFYISNWTFNVCPTALFIVKTIGQVFKFNLLLLKLFSCPYLHWTLFKVFYIKSLFIVYLSMQLIPTKFPETIRSGEIFRRKNSGANMASANSLYPFMQFLVLIHFTSLSLGSASTFTYIFIACVWLFLSVGWRIHITVALFSTANWTCTRFNARSKG